jgi:hypothetical protein
MAKGILIAAMDFTDVAEDEFNDWYDLEHLPERQRVPGFLACERWIGAHNPKISVATYELDNLEVLGGPELPGNWRRKSIGLVKARHAACQDADPV